MEKKSLESLDSSLFVLPTEAQRQIQGGQLDAESGRTRYDTWTAHQGHQDWDGYAPDTE